MEKIKYYLFLIFSVICFILVFAIIPEVKLNCEKDEYLLAQISGVETEDSDKINFMLKGIFNINDYLNMYNGKIAYNNFNTNFIIAMNTQLITIVKNYDNAQLSYLKNEEDILKYFDISYAEFEELFNKVKSIYSKSENNIVVSAIIEESSVSNVGRGLSFNVKVKFRSEDEIRFNCICNNEKNVNTENIMQIKLIMEER